MALCGHVEVLGVRPTFDSSARGLVNTSRHSLFSAVLCIFRGQTSVFDTCNGISIFIVVQSTRPYHTYNARTNHRFGVGFRRVRVHLRCRSETFRMM